MNKSSKIKLISISVIACLVSIPKSVVAVDKLTSEQLKELLVGNFVKLVYVYDGENINMWEFYQPDGTVTGSTDKWGSYSAAYQINAEGQMCLTYGESGKAYNGCYSYEQISGDDYKLTGLTWPENSTVDATVVDGLYKNIQNN